MSFEKADRSTSTRLRDHPIATRAIAAAVSRLGGSSWKRSKAPCFRCAGFTAWTPLIDLKPDRTLFKPIAPPQPGDFQTGDGGAARYCQNA